MKTRRYAALAVKGLTEVLLNYLFLFSFIKIWKLRKMTKNQFIYENTDIIKRHRFFQFQCNLIQFKACLKPF